MKRNKYVIGLTGGIGSGKSTVLHYLKANFRISAVSADAVGHYLMQPGESVYNALTERFSEEILLPDRTIDTGKLAQMIFEDDNLRAEVNAIEHPLIREEIIRAIEDTLFPIVFLEAALIKEGNLLPLCDEVWTVEAPREVRIRRLMSSRGYSVKKCGQMINSQLSDAETESFSDLVIKNGASFSETVKELNGIMEDLLMRKLDLILSYTEEK